MASEPTPRELLDVIARYLGDRLPAAQRARLQAELEACPGCVAFLNDFPAMARLARAAIAEQALPEDVPPELVAAVAAARDQTP